jgi:hypothetical protein
MTHVQQVQDAALHLTESYRSLLAGVQALNSGEEAVIAAEQETRVYCVAS